MSEERKDEPIEGEARAVGENATGAPEPAPAPGPGSELMPTQAPPPPSLAVAPRVKADDLVTRLDVIQQAADRAMKDGVDFGTIPGTEKPTLLKPGAEKLGVLFELDIQLANEKLWDPPHLTVVSRAIVFHAPTQIRLGYGEGLCTTHERKYAKRRANRKCPDCDAEAILRSRNEGEGWFCWRKRDGCGNQFAADDERITKQEVGEIENPNLPDTWNTVVKIAEKRARVDAVLAVTGASALFTQDVEDLEPEDRSSDAGKSSEEMKRKGGGRRKSSAKPITPAQKRRITNDLKTKVPEQFHDAIKATVRDGTTSQAGALIDKLKKLDPSAGELAKFLKGFGIEYAPASDVPADTSDLEASEREEEEARAAAEAEGGGDAVEQTLLGKGDDDA